MTHRGATRRLRVVYVGPNSGTSRHRARALADLGHSLIHIDTRNPPGFLKATVFRLAHRLRYPPDFARANRSLVETVSRERVDLVMVDKGLSIRPATLRAVKRASPKTRLVSYSPDDMFNPSNQSIPYLRSIPFYDHHVTTKSYNVAELKEAGARDVLFVNNAFDPHSHRPLDLTPAEMARYQADVGFIGGFETDRAEHILALARAGIEVTVWSASWPRRGFSHPNLRVHFQPLIDMEYTKGIVGARINLGFLRKCNRDLQTTRTMEIPGCGGFLLAERTDQHLGLFEESKEAEFFDSSEELIEKCRYYLAHEDERRRIAAAGRRKCFAAGYSNQDTLRSVLETLFGE